MRGLSSSFLALDLSRKAPNESRHSSMAAITMSFFSVFCAKSIRNGTDAACLARLGSSCNVSYFCPANLEKVFFVPTLVALQPGYLPWLGYFDLMHKADVFVHYDDVQFDKHGWRNRNRLKGAK